ncbi:unnamed protein product [Strongylus vulgaris]|uniref:Uncharacterized protein n=1 Tax=Strongylus vulgaris TaxID=40348 RepID=A0A3P7J5A2_STRVU|nr:unnamed protein product [Strongylus vulgaris]
MSMIEKRGIGTVINIEENVERMQIDLKKMAVARKRKRKSP